MKINHFETEKEFFYENGFYLTSKPYRLGNIMAHYELYKKIINLPGDVIELGVFKGGSFVQFCTFRELLENQMSRKIVGFDIFGEFPNTVEKKTDRELVKEWNEMFSEEFVSKDELERFLELKGFVNFELVQGNILKTIDEYLERVPQTRISFLHIDTDVYEPAKYGLERLFDRVVKGGIIVFDDYGYVNGETIAVDEFLKDKNYVLEKFPFSHIKPSFITKK